MMFQRLSWLLTALPFLLPAPTTAQQPPVIDMHMHTYTTGKPYETKAARGWQEAWDETLTEMDRTNIVLALASGVTEGPLEWRRLAPERVVAGALFPCDKGLMANGGEQCFENGETWPDIDWLRGEIESGRIGFLGEITTQYLGLAPNDPRMDPYYALAEELDIPVAIHIGPGFSDSALAGGACGKDPCSTGYRANLTDPMLLEDVLIQHPDLRILVMHAGWPRLEDMIQLLYAYSQVYVDIAVLTFDNFIMPRKAFHAYLLGLVDNGYGKRIVWGSDDPGLGSVDDAMEAIHSADFLSEKQKADIFYNNAARFLRLTDAEIAAHHER
jgi:hypothetical protein